MPKPLQLPLLLLVAIAGVWATRAPLMKHDLWNLDEGSTFTMAQQVLAGDVLYRDAADNRSPLVPYLKAAILAVAGDWNASAVHAVLTTLLGLVGFGLAYIARRLTGEAAAWGTLLAYLVLQILWVPVGDSLSANTEWFVVIFSTAGFVLLVLWHERPSLLRGFVTGLAFAGSVLCKQPGLLDGIVLLVLCGLLIWRSESAQRAAWWRYLGGAMIGIALPVMGFALYFVLQGAWDDYIYYAFTFNTAIYIPEVPLLQRLTAVRMPFVFGWTNVQVLTLLGGTAAVGLLATAWQDVRRPAGASLPLIVWLALGWTFAGLATTTLSGREFGHYTLQTTPGLSLAIGWLVHQLWHAQLSTALAQRITRGLVLGLAVAVSIMAVPRYRAIQAEIATRLPEPHPVSVTAQKFSAPDERIFIWGYYPELYFYAQRLPASRYLYTNYVTGMVPWTNVDPWLDVAYARSPNAEALLQADLKAQPPALIVDTNLFRNYARFPIEHQAGLGELVQTHYAQVAVAETEHQRQRLFRRLVDTTNAPAVTDHAVEDLLQITGHHDYRPESEARLAVRGAAGFTALTLHDGEQVLAHLPYPASEHIDMRFAVPEHAKTSSRLWVRATRADGSKTDSPFFDFGAYRERLRQERSTIAPLALTSRISFLPDIETRSPQILGSIYAGDSWAFWAPARLTWQVPEGIERILFTHGHEPQHQFNSDGYDIVVTFQPHGGDVQELLRKRLAANRNGDDQIPQHENFVLPEHRGGEFEITLTTGPSGDAEADSVYLTSLRLMERRKYSEIFIVSPPDLLFVENLPTRPVFLIDGHYLWSLHTTNDAIWTLPPGMATFGLSYGIEHHAYDLSRGHTCDGVEFSVRIEHADGRVDTLWSDLLQPRDVPEDVGIHHAVIGLPAYEQGAKLVLRLHPGPNNNDAFDWSVVGNFELLPADSPWYVAPNTASEQ